MTGFQLPRTTYTLQFDEPEYADLVIHVHGITLDELFELDEAQEAIIAAQGVEEVRKAILRRNTLFVGKIADWNVEDDGAPVPCTVDVLGSFEAPFVTGMFNAWRRAAAGVVPAPLDRPSHSGSEETEDALLGIPVESLAS